MGLEPMGTPGHDGAPLPAGVDFGQIDDAGRLLPGPGDHRVDGTGFVSNDLRHARVKRASTSRAIAELVESGLQAQDAERDRFLQLADRLTKSKDRAEQEQIKEELARVTFGD